jgi:hypothetical protein
MLTTLRRVSAVPARTLRAVRHHLAKGSGEAGGKLRPQRSNVGIEREKESSECYLPGGETEGVGYPQ